MAKKDYPNYETICKYVFIYNNGTYSYKRIGGDENPYSLLREGILSKEQQILLLVNYYSLIISEYSELYLVCHTDNSIRINLSDEIVDRRKNDAYVPYEFIHERAFESMFKWLDSPAFGMPREVNILIRLLKEDYPIYKRDAKLNKILK